jgi:hypothetical protein
VDITRLDIPINSIATALKEFVSKRISDLMPDSKLTELEAILNLPTDPETKKRDLKQFIRSLPPPNFALFRFLFNHFAR